MSDKKKSERRQRTELIGVRLLPAEYQVLRRAADGRGQSMSEFVRNSALHSAVKAARSVPNGTGAAS